MAEGSVVIKQKPTSSKQNLLGSIFSALSYRNCGPELGKAPSHAVSQPGSVRVTLEVVILKASGGHGELLRLGTMQQDWSP